MAEVYFYHYTTRKAAHGIVRKGRINPSVAANGDSIHGDGVYLTTLDPRLGEATIKNNNWDGVAAGADKKIEVYFEIMMPLEKVSMADDKRDIQVHKGPLQLINYKWSLKNWSGDILVTQYYMVLSEGRAKEVQSESMGKYTLVRNMVMIQSGTDRRTCVYKKDEGERFLYMNSNGNWCVSDTLGEVVCKLVQSDNNWSSLSPSKTLPWKYGMDAQWMDDNTLRVFPCYY